MTNYIAWLRAHVGPHLIPLAATTALIRDAQGHLLCQQRADFKHAWWGLPGGVLEPGETPEAALAREVLEETGLHVEPMRLVGVYSSPRYIVHYPNGDASQQVTSCYECRITGGALRPDADEILHLEFFPPDALPALPLWYVDMAVHALNHSSHPYFDPPERHTVDTPYPSLMAAREVVGHAPLVWPGANTLTFDDEGRLLLQHRADFDVWGLPAGALDTGETLAHTAIRETHEETGLWVEPQALLAIFAGRKITYPNGDELFPVGHSFLCRVVGGELRPNDDDSLDARFFPLDALPPMCPVAQERLNQLRQQLTTLVDRYPSLSTIKTIASRP
jgi:ADP-ribose pyrophosphatase YjhB (NUDIX family)